MPISLKSSLSSGKAGSRGSYLALLNIDLYSTLMQPSSDLSPRPADNLQTPEPSLLLLPSPMDAESRT